jgi:GMP synthase-like glutamine amidotransferase
MRHLRRVRKMMREGARVAIIDNSIDPAVYKPIDHWREFLGVPWEAFRAADSCFPDLDKKYTHLILTGSEASILERENWVYEEVEVVQKALDRGIPILGSCYGHQLLALALRGPTHVRRCPLPEVGWIPVKVGRKNALLGDEGEAYTFALHFDEVIGLDDDFVILASTPACRVQAFALRTQPAGGIQPHPEINASAARELLQNLIRLELKTSFLYEAALTTRPRDSGLIRRIVRHFLASCERL